ASFCFKYAMPADAIASGATVGGFVAAEACGGVGALIIARTAFPPVTAFIGACILGGVCAGTAIILVKTFIQSTTEMIESLKQISSLDISNWTNTSNVISFFPKQVL
ncbi:unnamed protein product, partial [Didymodactylos carnosus]